MGPRTEYCCTSSPRRLTPVEFYAKKHKLLGDAVVLLKQAALHEDEADCPDEGEQAALSKMANQLDDLRDAVAASLDDAYYAEKVRKVETALRQLASLQGVDIAQLKRIAGNLK